MQRHSGLGSQQSSKNNKPTQQQQQQFTNYTTTNTTTTAAAASTSKAAAAQTAIASQQQQRQLVKVIKCKTPLHQFKFYLDICDNQLAKKIEEQIKALGGILEFFLNASVTHFITDKSVLPGAVANCSQPGTPNSNPTTPQTPLNIENAANKQQNKRQTRADTLLNRARRQTTTAAATTTTTSNFNLTPIKATTNSAVAAVGAAAAAAQLPYIVWQTDYAQRFLQKVQAELKRYLSSARDKQASVANAIQLKTAGGAYIKIEAKDNKQQAVFRPYYQLFRKPASEWPKIDLLRDEGAFRLTAKKPIQNMTRKSRSRSSQTQRRQANATTTTTTAATAAVVATNNKKQNVCNSAAATATATATAATAVACKNYKESSDKQCGICEICKIEYDALSIHLQTKEHEFFARNSQNFIALDTLIQNTANVNKFLLENSNSTTATTTTTPTTATKCGLEEMEYDETAISATAAAAATGTALAADELNASDPLRQTPISRCNSAVHYKTPSPTLREKSKRSTKGKHSSEKFQNTSKHQQHTAALLPATATITHAMRKKTTSAASGLSPPMRARLPNSNVYKVVETTELCTPLRKDARNAQTIASPSITIKFKKVRTAELQRLNGEAESFMFPKQQRTSSEPTDVDRQTSMEEIAQTSSYCLDSSVSSELMPMQNAAATARKSKCKNARQSFPNAPIQPKIQLKKVTAATTTTTKTTTNSKAAANSKSNKAAQMAATLMALTLPEATRKSSRTATAIVTAATTSSRLLRAAVEAAKHNSRQQLQEQHQQQQQTEIESNEMLQPPVNAKSNTATTATTAIVLPKKLPEQRRTVARNSIVKLEDRMGEAQQQAMQATTTTRTRTTKMKTEQTMPESINNTPRTRRSTIKTPSKEANHCTPRKRARIAKYAYDDDDDFDFEAECETTADDDDDDEDFIVRERCRTYRSQSVAARSINNSYSRRGNNSNMSLSVAVRDRANRRQNRQSLIRIEQHIQTDLGKNSNNMKVKEEKMEPTIKAQEATPVVVAAVSVSNKKQAARKQQRKRPSTLTAEQQSITTSQKPNEDTKTIKVAEAVTTTEVSPTTSTATNSTDKPSPKRFYDYNKSEHLRKLKFAFERLPESDLWYRVYKRQDVGEEQYFAYFGSRNYRKLPYELGPIPFDSTIDAMDCCKLCQRQQEAKEGKVKSAKVQQQQQEQEQPTSSLRIKEEETKTTAAGSSSSFNGFLSSSAQYAHKHKKLHLLQRYQQEQQQLLLQQKQEERLQEENAHTLAKCDSKTNLAVSLPPVNRMRADSTHSNTSSCASSSAATSINRSKPYRNKQLSRVAYLSLELPPRKSPREHASTLALVSSIKQRQDSQSSQQNSETEEPTAPMLNMLNVKEEQQQQQQQIQAEQKVELQTTATVAAELPIIAAAAAKVSAVVAVADSKDSLATVKAARSAASTPVEEVRYATAICESVKRMRRGQNKYDHSPPYVHHQPRTARVRKVPAKLGRPRKLQNIVAASQSPNPSRSQTPHSNASGRKHIGRPRTAAGNQRRKALYVRSASATTFKRRAGLTLLSVANKLPLISDEQAMPSIRKTGCKKGVLEFEIDKAALKALQVTRTYENPRRLAWEIDKYLQLACRDYDLDIDMANVNAAAAELAADDREVVPPAAVAAVKIEASSSSCSNGIITTDINTPPPTEHFSSDFDLCDLFNAAGDAIGGATADESADGKYRNGGGLNLYNSVAERRYFNKRRSLKANRTGWPKTQRRKPAVNKQHMLRQKSRYFNGKTPMMMNGIANDLLLLEQQNEIVRLKAVITPPASELDAHKVQHKKTDIETVQTNKTEQQDDYDEDGTNTEQDAAESLPDENDADIEADEEEEEEDEDDDDDDDDDDASMVTAAEHVYVEDEDSLTMSTDVSKRTRYNADATQNIDNALQVNCNTPVLSSTPNNKQQILRGLRRNNTPQHQQQQQQQLNGSLASCVSPCEKAGDHSDIFTVSSDGLDTDLDVSNHQQQQQHNHHNHKVTVPATVENENCTERIPKRRLDITKYAPGGAASKPCAAEAATAAAKSLAISQFLSKGVRVQCRRLPALRRIRYRR